MKTPVQEIMQYVDMVKNTLPPDTEKYNAYSNFKLLVESKLHYENEVIIKAHQAGIKAALDWQFTGQEIPSMELSKSYVNTQYNDLKKEFEHIENVFKVFGHNIEIINKL